jgi:tetratricopeptide (TPR) repeat protein
MRKPYPDNEGETDTHAPVTVEFRDELANIRNLSIKTEHQLKQVASEVKAIGAQRASSRIGQALTSGIAYLLFSILLGIGAYLYVHSKLELGENQKELFVQKEKGYQAETAELRGQLGRWKQIERELLEFERLVRKGHKEAAVAKFSSLKNVRFAGLLEGLVERFRSEVATSKFNDGLDLFRKGSFDRADALFVKSLEFDDAPNYHGSLLYHQGMAALRLKDFTRSADLIRRALEFKLNKSILGDARYHLAYAHDRMGEKRTAKDLYFRFFQRHSKHGFAPRAKRRYERLKAKRNKKKKG